MEKILGHYQLNRLIGRGGMSMVYEATDLRMGRRVAVKVLTCPNGCAEDELDSLYRRQVREARAIAALSHPNIVTIHDVGSHDDQHYLVMEYLDGVTLRACLKEGPLSLEEAASILEQIAGALDAVHAHGIIHRDLKPSNIMLLPDGRVKMLDFGIARHADDTQMTQTGSILGSPSYMAPEQVRGEAGSAASDLWSMGVILYEMIAGRAPFSGQNIPAILHDVAYAEPSPIPEASPGAQQVIAKALSKDPNQRYTSARQMATEFRAAMSEPVSMAAVARPIEKTESVERDESEDDTMRILPLRVAHEGVIAPRRPVNRRRSLALLPLLLVLWLIPFGVLAWRNHQSSKPAPHIAEKPAVQKPQRVASAPAPRAMPVTPTVSQTQSKPNPKAEAVTRKKTRRRRVRRQTSTISTTPTVVASAPAEKTKRVRRPKPPSVTSDRTVQAPVKTPRRYAHHRTADTPTPSAPSMLGTWQGSVWRNQATLSIDRHQGNSFSGTMHVRTPEGRVSVAVSGEVSPRTGQVTMREDRVVRSDRPNAWDLGSESGQLSGSGLGGSGRDTRGRRYSWSFSR